MLIEQQISMVKSKLSSLLNTKVVYGLSEFMILDYKYQNGIERFIIEVSDREEKFELSPDAAVDFVRECKPKYSTSITTSEEPKEKKEVTKVTLKSTDLKTTQTLKEILLDNIQNIKDNSLYIPQAEAISKQVGQVINVIRTEMECIRLAKALSEGNDETNS